MTFKFRTLRRRSIVAIEAFAVLLLCSQVAHSSDYLSRPDVHSFMQSMHLEHGLPMDELERVLGSARHQPTVVRLIGPVRTPAVAPVRSYPAYRAKFLTKSRIAAGVRYWDDHDKYLLRAEREFGVPPEVILGIIGVETAYGQNTGSFRVVDALATIAFDGPRRQDYFREELKELLLLARESGFDPLAIKGSYAGAMGLPQFMPSSYRRYAIDFDGDGAVNIRESAIDAIGSVASYLSAFGWVSDQPATASVRLPSGAEAQLVSGLERVHSVADLKDQGVTFGARRLPQEECSVVEVPTPGKPPKYLAGFANFEAITRYNRSTFYAMAVLDLADAIRSSRERQLTANAN
jgi:membrane-bound lytic murein transglycosylase B